MRLLRHPDDVDRTTAFGEIVQIAYHAPDIERAANWFATALKAGPFYLLEHVGLSTSLYRGNETPFDHSSAYGQYGDIMIELIHQHDDQPSAVRDMYAANAEGLHHFAIFVDNLDAAIEEAVAAGMACALDATTTDGVRFVMVDAREAHGCMLEFYEQSELLDKFYSFVKRKSRNWDRSEVLRHL
jgi:catechol 2,3-dioxygenase-like lactoylglutathione lyase family enzyme